MCEGNVCRSPWAEITFRSAWGVTTDADLVAMSAGTHALRGHRAHPLLESLCARDEERRQVERHRSRRVDARLLREQDLVLVMERRLRADLLDSWPAALHRTFIIGEVDRLVRLGPPTVEEHGLPLTEVLARRRRPQDSSAGDDVDDPVRGTAEDFHHMGDRIGRMTRTIVPFVADVMAADTTRRDR
ncbi:hypothetical protein [Curtobacterium sp. MCPF17_046]|uniref:arsenate reductase/protein-tyrosine-phosphatase family protein n=1 Tax=Curtobacterium sp. MCPF17_046 TaxID=2175663 RepID=UPI0021AC9FAB|nr:hypothetical protein [Curtobacterium sp. MCPF17_046]